MTWSFSVTSGIPQISQSGTDSGLAGIATAITAQATVARSTAYTTSQMVKPPTPTGFWYRCSTAGTTAATAPTYGTTLGGTTTDGTAVFTAFRAPDVLSLGTQNHYYMPDFRFAINGTLTNANPQIQTFTCWDLIQYGAASIFTSGAWAADGVTPLYDGLHFAATRVSFNGSDNSSGGLQLQNVAQFTFIGGEVQVAGAIGFAAGTTPRSYYTRWRNTKQWGGVSSTRVRSYSNTAIFRSCEFYDIAYDLFQMPAEFSVKARKSEYVAQYVGSYAGGVDAYFKASALENVDGSYDFDNYGNGYVELFNCAKGANLNVVTQLNATMCTPLYQDLVITAKNTSGVAVQDVRFTCTDVPNNSPTQTFTTRGNLKTWDFRSPLTYQATTNASGVATSSPILQVWYYSGSLQKNLRFPASTATYEGRAYGYKTVSVSIVLGANAAQQLSAGMVGLDTATTVTEAVAAALTGITFTASGATGGSITISEDHTWQDLWNYYRYWISQFANRSSNDTWTCAGGLLNMGAWSLTVDAGKTLSTTTAINAATTTGTITANGTINGTYTDGTGTRVTIKERTGKLLSTYVTINGTPTGGTVVDGSLRAGWVPLSAARVITVQPTDAVRIAASYYGSKPAIFNLTGADIASFTLSLDTETAVDTTVSATTRDAIAASFDSVQNGAVLEVTVNRTFKQYSDVETLAGLDYYITSRGYRLHAAIAQLNSASFYAITSGTVVVYTTGFKIRVADLAPDGTTQLAPTTNGYEIPLVVYYQDPATGVKSTMTVLNQYGAFLGTAPWTKSQASIGDSDQQLIASKVLASAAASPITANITKMNGVLLKGSGHAGDTWGPAV